jgi:uncharacterized protein (DUF302 family)
MEAANMHGLFHMNPVPRSGDFTRSKRQGLSLAVCLLFAAWFIPLHGAAAQSDEPLAGTVTLDSSLSFEELSTSLEEAVEANEFAVVTRASASAGAASRGVTIPGNLVVGVYRNDYAVRMLEASVPAGIEAPLRFYVTENADGTASLTYREPTAVFAPYGVPELDAMAAELDPIWRRIAEQATGE